MNYKEIIEDILKTKSKSKLCNELGISQYYLDKILQGEEVPDLVKTKVINMVASDNEDTEVVSITKPEEDFITDAPIDTFPDKVNRISYLNYVLNSTKVTNNHYWKQLLTKNGTTTDEQKEDQLERLVNAILSGNWKVIEEDVPYMIKLPSYHYLTKMVDGSTGWSLVQNAKTVVGSSKEELLKQYPEYEDFIVQEPLNVVSFKPQGEKSRKFTPNKKKGFVIRDARKNY
nr:MAG TPA: LAMBDA CRO REPRESSOR-TURN-HELIX, Viral protein.05A [Caudoviricetes sp.]